MGLKNIDFLNLSYFEHFLEFFIIAQILCFVGIYMGTIFWLAVVIAIASTLIGSMIFQFLIPNAKNSLVASEEKCKKIAKEGFEIHQSYPDFQPDQLPTADMNRLLYLDELWIKDCVSVLPAESIFNIVQKVEQDFYSRE